MHDDAPDSTASSPFATPSYEPRFAIDCRGGDLEVLEMALRLHVGCNNWNSWRYEDGAAVFSAFHDARRRLAVAAQLGGFPGEPRERAWAPLFGALERTQAAAAIQRWLVDDAEFPKRPWFDGGEMKGFRVYHVAYGQPQLGPYGFAIVEPKWFEVHK